MYASCTQNNVRSALMKLVTLEFGRFNFSHSCSEQASG